MKDAKFTTWYEENGKIYREYFKTETEAQTALEVLAKEFAQKKPGGTYELELDYNWAMIDYPDGTVQLVAVEDIDSILEDYPFRRREFDLS